MCEQNTFLFQVKKFRLRFLFVLLVALAGFSASTLAQQATIVGTVTDPSGAVIPNVAVSITNIDTGWNRVFPTNEAGQYVAPDLQIGHYQVKATAAGFKAAEQRNIALTVGDRIRVDFPMQMGAAQETVTVEATAVRVQATRVRSATSSPISRCPKSQWLGAAFTSWLL